MDRGRAQAIPFGVFYFSFFTAVGVSSPYLQVLLRDLGYGPGAVGVFLGLFDLVGILGPLVVAPFADSRKRYKGAMVALLACGCATIVPLAMARAPALTGILVVLYGIALRGIIPVADAFVSTVSLASGARLDYGRVRSLGSAGFIAIGLFIQITRVIDEESSLSIALWIAGTGAIAALAALFLPSAGARAKVADFAADADIAADADLAAGTLISTKVADHAPIPGAFWVGLCVIGMGRLGMVPFNSFLSLYLKEGMHWDAVSGMWALGAIAEAPFMFLSGFFLRKFGTWKVILISLAAITVRLALYVVFPSPGGVIAAQLLHSICFGLFYPATVAFTAATVPEGKRTLGMALNLSIGSALPTLLGNVAGGHIIEFWGYPALFLSFAAFPAVGALVFLFFGKGLRAAEARR